MPAPADPPHDPLEAATERLLAVPIGERGRVLDDLVREQPALAESLRRLAADLLGAERLLDTGFAAPAEPMPAIGPYRVVRVIGEGAFGVVHLCTQETPVRREVAVKVLRPGAGDRHTLARFEAERHVLATLNHPAIAQVFDAGELPDGRPYFVMEYVRGVPISTHCDRHRLGIDARLELFVRLCQGAQHAHAQGIVHRDFKPANVLVFDQDGQPQPKIIDFGIARAVYQRDDGAAIRTETGRVVGTPGYMSPEQAAGGRSDLDARADVFSLGVMLYELLTGEMPWGRRPTTTDSEPLRPSARVAGDTAGDVARHRSIPPRKLVSRLRGDLDWIVLEALAHERERRYASAQDLAADVLRHLRGEPVLAGPPALGYRLRKLARRHRAMFTAAGLVAVTLAAGLWLSLGFRAEARTWAADVEAAAASLMARARDKSIVELPHSHAVRKALVEDALGLYEKLLQERPTEPKLREGRARALWTLSQVHWLVGEYARSEAAAREATSEAEALLAADAGNVVYRGILGAALRNLGRAASSGGRLDAARAAFERAVKELGVCHAREPTHYSEQLVRALLEWVSSLTTAELDVCAGAMRRAVTIQEEAVRLQPSVATSIDLLDALSALGQILTMKGDRQEAAQTLQRAEELLRATPEAGPGQVCNVLSAGAMLAGLRGNARGAIQRLHKAIEAAQKWVEQEPSWLEPRKRLLDLRGSLVQQLAAQGDVRAVAEASKAAIASAEAMAARFTEDPLANGQLAAHLGALATALLPLGRRDVLAEAETCARRAFEVSELVPDSVDLRLRLRARWLFLCHLGIVLDARGSSDAPATWEQATQAIDAWRERFGVGADDAVAFVEASLRVARYRLGAGSDDRAGEVLDRLQAVVEAHPTIEGMPEQAVTMHRLRTRLLARRGDDAGTAAESERVRSVEGGRGVLAAAEGMYAAWRAARSGSDPARAARHRDRAIELHRGAIDALREAAALSPADPWIVVPLGQSSIRLAEMLGDRGEEEAAQDLLAEALPSLAAVRDQVHADMWDEALYLAGQAMAKR